MIADDSGRHVYISTACWHDLHDRCRLLCKFCATPCLCLCHRRPPTRMVEALRVAVPIPHEMAAGGLAKRAQIPPPPPA